MPKAIKSEIWNIVILFLIWRIGLFIVSYFGIGLPNYPQTRFYDDIHPVFSMWMPYDAGWFVQISQEGYGFSEQARAFFPFWPLVIMVVSKIFYFIDPRIIAFFLANFFTLAACIMLYKLTKFEFSDKDLAYRSVKYLLFFPMSLFLATSYTEPLFLLLVISSFYFIRKYKSTLFSSLTGMSAALTRIVGIIIFIPLLIETTALTLKEKKSKIWQKIKKFIPLILVPTGLILYMVYLKFAFSDGLAFLHAQSAWGKSLGINGLYELWNNIKIILSFNFFLPNGAYATSFWLVGVLLVFIIIIISAYKKIRLSYLAYALLVLLLPLAGGNLVSMNRFTLVAFPVFIIIAFWGRKRWVDEAVTIIFLLLLGFYTVMFTRGYWVG